jgi:hypothetical protein
MPSPYGYKNDNAGISECIRRLMTFGTVNWKGYGRKRRRKRFHDVSHHLQ